MSRLERLDITFGHWSRERSKESPGSDSYERDSSRALLIGFCSSKQCGSVEIRSDQVVCQVLTLWALAPSRRWVGSSTAPIDVSECVIVSVG